MNRDTYNLFADGGRYEIKVKEKSDDFHCPSLSGYGSEVKIILVAMAVYLIVAAIFAPGDLWIRIVACGICIVAFAPIFYIPKTKLRKTG